MDVNFDEGGMAVGAARMANNKTNVTDVMAELINIRCKL